MLSSAEIIADAEARVGIKDTDPPGIRRNLDRLVDSINNDQTLPEKGEALSRRALVDRTADRLEAQKWLRDFPEIADEQIVEPVFLTGLPRSGTTFFQYLFDRDERFRLIRTWEAIAPSPPPGFDPESVKQRKAEEGERRRRARPDVKDFDALHLTDTDGPEECHAFMEHPYAAIGFHNLFNVPSYFNYLKTELNFTEAYHIHKRQLQLLQWRLPTPRWALKYPGHVLAMDSIVEVHPSARFVMTHRDPVQTLASLCKLTVALRSARYEEQHDPHLVGRQLLDFVQLHIDRIMAFTGGADGNRITHVDYYRLLDNPSLVMTEVHASLGIDSPDQVRQAVADWHRDNPKGARGSNPYSLEQYGLNADAVAEQFSTYMQRFGIPREQAGLLRRAD